MPFTPRNWTDGSAPAVSAANIEDLETRTTDYANLRGSAMMFDVKNDFGAVGDGATDDTAAIQDAIDAADVNGGGVVFFPAGDYEHTGISLVSMSGIQLVGVGGAALNDTHSRLIYTAAGTIGYDLRSTDGCNLENLGISWDNAGFTGNLISFRSVAYDAARNVVNGCTIGPRNGRGVSPSQSVRSLIDLDTAITTTVQNSVLFGGQYAIHGRAMTPGGYSYSNAIRIYDNEFTDCSPAFICNPGENWVVRDNIFECQAWGGVGTGPSSIYKTHYESGSGEMGGQLLYEGNWTGDSSSDWRRDFDVLGGTAHPDTTDFVIRNNQMLGSTLGNASIFRGGGDLHFEQNSIGGGPGPVINLGTAGVDPGHNLVRIVGNNLGLSGTATTDVVSGYNNCTFIEMHGNVVSEYKNVDQIIFGGHVNFGRRYANVTQPTWSAGASLGVGGTVSGYGNDTTGRVDITTGAGATSGHLATMTYQRRYDTYGPAETGITPSSEPKVFLMACYSGHAGTLQLYHDFGGGANIPKQEARIACANVPQDSVTHRFWYWIVV